MKKIIRLTESDLHRIVKESVNRVLRESSGEIATYYGSKNMLGQGGNGGAGTILGQGVIYLMAEPSDMYGNMIPFDVDVSDFYRAQSAWEARDIAKNNDGSCPGVIYYSRHDGEVCAVFDQSRILGPSSTNESVNRMLREEEDDFESPYKKFKGNGTQVGKIDPEELKRRMAPTKAKKERRPQKGKTLGDNAKGFDKLRKMKF